jgi:subtilisin family serine protease/subtilisin-like proprotein convertase family protein
MTKILPPLSIRPEPENGSLKLEGSYVDYDILVQDERIVVTDLRDKGFGRQNYKKDFWLVKFDDISEISLMNKNPLHISDIVDFDGVNEFLIPQSQLTSNDKDYYGRALNIKSVTNPVGGSVELKDGMIKFTPIHGFNGVRKFSYTVKNEDGFVNTKPINVYLREPHHPNDPKFFDQWYIHEANVPSVWKDYTGKGVNVAVYDSSFVPPNNDLDIKAQEYSLKHDTELNLHGYQVSSIIAAKNNNGVGGTGIAFDSALTLHQLSYTDMHKINFQFFKEYDVVNNSWGMIFSEYLYNKNVLAAKHSSQLEDAVMQGREGKGTNVVFAAGNSGDIGDDSNASYLTSLPYVITTSGYTKPIEDIGYGRKLVEFTTSGASVLVSAAVSEFEVPDAGNISIADGQIAAAVHNAVVHGTSFSAPVVTSVVALMLEANAKLGFRDVQDILAICAKQKSQNAQTNAAKHFNGGGLQFDRLYGFGAVDAKAAVRLAELWESFHTFKNYEQTYSLPIKYFDLLELKAEKEDAKENLRSYTFEIDVKDEIDIEFVKLSLNAEFPNSISSYKISLFSPKGTEFVMLDKVGVGKVGRVDLGFKSINTDLGLQHARGEDSKGNWKVKIVNADRESSKNTFILKGLGLNFLGKPLNETKEMFYTDSFTSLYSEARSVVPKDFKIINASAVSGDLLIDLTNCKDSTISGEKIVFDKGHQIHTIKAGDGDDVIFCNDSGNVIYPGRGNDKIYLGNGADVLVYHDYKVKGLGEDTIYNFDIAKDKLAFFGGITTEQLLSSVRDSSNEQSHSATIEFDDWSVKLDGILSSQITQEVFVV